MTDPSFDTIDALNVLDVALHAYADVWEQEDQTLRPGAIVMMARVVALLRPVLVDAALPTHTRTVLNEVVRMAAPLLPTVQ